MVHWCKKCGALIGLQDPLTDWSVDRTTVCRDCVEKEAQAKSPADSDEGPLPVGAASE